MASVQKGPDVILLDILSHELASIYTPLECQGQRITIWLALTKEQDGVMFGQV
jgi:hypothetical protein